ncbi:MAG: hypothetical protein ACFFD4_15940 [Candidatus Odinarchaeota archaeon]
MEQKKEQKDETISSGKTSIALLRGEMLTEIEKLRELFKETDGTARQGETTGTSKPRKTSIAKLREEMLTEIGRLRESFKETDGTVGQGETTGTSKPRKTSIAEVREEMLTELGRLRESFRSDGDKRNRSMPTSAEKSGKDREIQSLRQVLFDKTLGVKSKSDPEQSAREKERYREFEKNQAGFDDFDQWKRAISAGVTSRKEWDRVQKRLEKFRESLEKIIDSDKHGLIELDTTKLAKKRKIPLYLLKIEIDRLIDNDVMNATLEGDILQIRNLSMAFKRYDEILWKISKITDDMSPGFSDKDMEKIKTSFNELKGIEEIAKLAGNTILQEKCIALQKKINRFI